MTKARQKTTHSWTVNFDSEVDDTKYVGTFTAKKLSIMDIAALGVRKAQLNGGMYFDPNHPGKGVDFETDDYNAMIAHLELSLIQVPEWWNLKEICDASLITSIYKEVAKFETTFLERRRGASTSGGSVGVGSESGDRNVSKTDAAGSVREVVGQEVLAALEP